MEERLTITEVAKSLGVTPRTIMRWEKNGKIKKSRRDWRGWRFYLKEDIDSIRKFYESSYDYDPEAKTVFEVGRTALIALLTLGFSLFTYTIGATSLNAAGAPAVVETKSSVDINLANLPTIDAGAQPDATEATKYTLGPNDVVQIDVRRHPEFSGLYPINAEGKIEYKFVGDIYVNGITKAKLQENLTKIVSEYVIEPEVNVQITSYMSKTFYVVGEVHRPGKFCMKANTIDVREALVQAGLPTDAAAMRRCRLIRPSAEKKNQYTDVNAYELLYGGDLKENIEMQPGDVLYVPSTVMAKVIKFIRPVTDTASSAIGSAAAGAAMAL